MILERIAARLINTPLLITPEYGAVVTTALADRLGVEPMVGQNIVDSYKRPNIFDSFNERTGIMTVPVVGGLVHRGDNVDALSGMQSYTALHNKLSALFADDKTRGVLIDGDTGGGEAAGLAELAEWLPQASAQAGKPVWWLANTVTGSAAYWLASAADRFYAAPQSRVGSIGVYVQHTDMSKAVERRGLVVSFIYAGKHKVDGNPFGPLPDEVRASIQERVDQLYSEFVGAVATNRGLDEAKVRETQARVYGPQDAYDLGLVDGVGGLGDVLAAFADHLKRPFVGYSSQGDHMTTKLIYGQDDLDRARTEASAEATAAITAITSKLDAATADRKALLEAFSALAPGNPRVEVFVEALNDGASVALASKVAGRVELPKTTEQPHSATQADVDRLLRQHAPNISDNGGNASETDPKAARLAELQGSMKAFNTSKGYTPAH